MRMNASYRLRPPPPPPAWTPKIKETPREIITSFRVSISCWLTLCFVFLHLAEMIVDSNFSLLSQQFLVTFWTITRDPIPTTTAATARTSKEQKQTTNKQQQAGRQQQILRSIKIWTHKKKMPQFSKLNGCITIQTLIVQTAEIQHLLARNNTQRVKLAVSSKVSLGTCDSNDSHSLGYLCP